LRAKQPHRKPATAKPVNREAGSSSPEAAKLAREPNPATRPAPATRATLETCKKLAKKAKNLLNLAHAQKRAKKRRDIKMTAATLTRTELTAHETAQLHRAKLEVAKHSLAVGAFVTRYGNEATLTEAAELFLELLESLTADSDIRPAALEYGMTSATWAANDRNASQAHQLRGEFLKMLFSAAMADKLGA
jgi:hypothetical protein